MSRFILAALLAAGASVPAQASEQTWTFTYSPLLGQVGSFLSESTLTGFFRGTDLNDDGTLQASELTNLVIDRDYVTNCTSEHTSEIALTCALVHFSFTASTGTLAFETRWEMEGYSPARGMGRTIRTGWSDHSWANLPGGAWTDVYSFTPDTTLTLTLAMPGPVPEPEAYAMLAAGLALLGGARLRSRKARGPA